MLHCDKDLSNCIEYNSTTEFDKDLKYMLATKILGTVISEVGHVLYVCRKHGYDVDSIDELTHSRMIDESLNGEVPEYLSNVYLDKAFDILEALEYYGFDVVKRQ